MHQHMPMMAALIAVYDAPMLSLVYLQQMPDLMPLEGMLQIMFSSDAVQFTGWSPPLPTVTTAKACLM